ncbi:MAG: hypothetical protein J6B30_04085 [Muribaculaceae bacterium]|nr:hypothetical protein [Muribaculaceae bacterium]
MTCKECKKYLNDANKILIQGSFSDAMNLKMKLIEEFKKEENNEWVNILEKISFLPYYQTASNDPASIERRGTAIRNGIQEIINILNQYLTTQKDKIDNRRFWLSLGLSIFAILLSIALWLVDKFLPLCN